MVLRSKIALVAAFAFALSGIVSAHCPVTISFVSGGLHLDHLANNGYDSSFDMLDLSSSTGTLTLSSGIPASATVNSLVFSVGYSSNGVYQGPDFNASWPLTVNGVTRSLTQTVRAGSSTGPNGEDVLQMLNGQTTTYDLGIHGTLSVTPVDYTLTTAIFGGNPGSVTAVFQVQGLAPSAMIDHIIADVHAAVQSGASLPADGNSLIVKLDGAKSKLGNLNACLGQLGAFINQVQALVKTHHLDAATGQDMISDAQCVIAELTS